MIDLNYALHLQQEALKLMSSKNKDYGKKIDNISITGLEGIAVRLLDKVSRLYSLADGQPPKIKTESIRDTLIDTMNYALIGLMLVDGHWGGRA